MMAVDVQGLVKVYANGPEALATVREWKKAQKAAGKTKQQ